MKAFRMLRQSSRRALCAATLALCAAPALADTPIVLFKSFAGNVTMTGTQKSLRTKSNDDDPCATTTSVNMSLSGLPTGARVLAAYLYWAGSGSSADYSVTFDGKAVSAPATRRYTSSTVGYNYFGGAADVTDQVKAKGNGTYSAKDLAIDKSLFCAVSGVLGGFQLLVIYSASDQPFRVLNVYEGFQYIRYSSLELTLANFLIPNPPGTGRVGHITWEGDTTLSGGGETLRFNGVEQADATNQPGNQFNSVSGVNGDKASYGIDFDVYTIKEPAIASGQKSAKTIYTSGQDLVLLNAEVIAAPNVSATDRGVTMTLDGPLIPSAPTTYTISVVNNGPMDEGGPLTVTGTLPASLIYGEATGTGWSCSTRGQLLTCIHSGTVKVDTTLPPITLTVTPAASASGLISFGVTVGGKLFDYYDGNDTSTVSTRVGNQTFTPVFMFTDKPCEHNKPFGDPNQPCKPLTLEHMQANTDLSTYISYVVKNVPTALASGNTTLPMRFAMSCHDPSTNAGVRGTYALRSNTVTLPLCAANGVIPPQDSVAWSAASNVMFPGGSPSSQATTTKNRGEFDDFLLRYQDVGRIELFVTDADARLGSTGAFVSRPEKLLLLAQSSNKAGDPASATDPRFVPAGTPFTMTVRALMQGLTVAAPNFGRETEPEKIKLRAVPASTEDGSPIRAMVADREPGKYFDPVDLEGEFGPFVSGIATGTFVFDDLGVIKVDSMLAPTPAELAENASREVGSYLGTGNVVGTTINVGRFYPDHFDTIVTGPMECAAAVACPKNPSKTTVPSVEILTMAYSGQPFTVDVKAFSSRGTLLKNYRDDLAHDVLLSAWKAPNGATAQDAPLAGTTKSVLSTATITAGAFDAGTATVTRTYTFPSTLAYNASAPNANNWPQPVSVYLRAAEVANFDDVTSKRAAAVEGGVRIAAGRWFVPNLQGSAALAMDVPVRPQFFSTQNGIAAWYDSVTDSATTFAPLTEVNFSACTKLAGASGCKLALTVDKATVGKVSAGAGTVKLLAPGSGSSGSVYMWMTGPAWLPSVRGVLTYGTVSMSPYTYLREIY
ncbi:hypothetical protein GCM10007387_20830 [Pseudoduganella albidiflava]|uniref:DUF11 domain-containing protein n=2 Tax=Pseudoduganella albidiflava TaxID=321983 RepID=A0AA87XW70_9BURK|nr:hypothetical protein GCM10007387_20830 [Pseudoduganella albidiflava]